MNILDKDFALIYNNKKSIQDKKDAERFTPFEDVLDNGFTVSEMKSKNNARLKELKEERAKRDAPGFQRVNYKGEIITGNGLGSGRKQSIDIDAIEAEEKAERQKTMGKAKSIGTHAAVGGVAGLATGGLLYRKTVKEYALLARKKNLSPQEKARIAKLKSKLNKVATVSTLGGSVVGAGVGYYRSRK